MTETTASPPPRWVLLGLAVLTVVVVGVLSLALFRDDLEPVPDDGAVLASPGSAPVADDFDRPDGDGLADGAHPWQEPRGAWGVRDGHAALLEPAPAGSTSLAVLPGETGDGVVRVTVTAVEPGWGLAFRVQDDANHWALVARDTATWSLVLVQDGALTETAVPLTLEPRDGTAVEVELLGDRIEVRFDGTVAGEVEDATFVDATGFGLLSLTADNVASMAWDELSLSPA